MTIKVDIIEVMQSWQDERAGPYASYANTVDEAQEIITMALKPLIHKPELMRVAVHALLGYAKIDEIREYLDGMEGD